MLIKVGFRITFDVENKVAPICLLPLQSDFVAVTGIATGWGHPRFNKSICLLHYRIISPRPYSVVQFSSW